MASAAPLVIGLHAPGERWKPEGTPALEGMAWFGVEVDKVDEDAALARLEQLRVAARVVGRSNYGSQDGYAVLGVELPVATKGEAQAWFSARGFDPQHA